MRNKEVERWVKEQGLGKDEIKSQGMGIFMPRCEWPDYIQDMMDSEAHSYEVYMGVCGYPEICNHYDD